MPEDSVLLIRRAVSVVRTRHGVGRRRACPGSAELVTRPLAAAISGPPRGRGGVEQRALGRISGRCRIAYGAGGAARRPLERVASHGCHRPAARPERDEDVPRSGISSPRFVNPPTRAARFQVVPAGVLAYRRSRRASPPGRAGARKKRQVEADNISTKLDLPSPSLSIPRPVIF